MLLALAAGGAAALAGGVALAQGGPPTLGLPVACEVGRTCFVQSYVDHGGGGEPRDHRCGPQTYAGHDGIDFRLPDTARQRAGVAVLSAAAGTVKAVRDGMADQPIAPGGQAAVAGRECGNGVMLDHPGGWSTQYCHMARGSIRVRPGQSVPAGTPLGLVGLSGQTEFPHLHLTVRRGDAKVDPFTGGEPSATCGGPAKPLWAPKLAAQLSYRDPQLINAGFAPGPVSMEAVESGAAAAARPDANAPALVAYARTIGLQTGDQLTLKLIGSDGRELAVNAVPPMPRAKAQWLSFVGKRRTTPTWPRGTYRLRVEVKRGDKAALSEERALTL